ncbi:RecX family transcriptional regulator [Patescibacteria group bacterium]|nr:RecX family transcriptional regulator [Patescibacteria group bacterium]
MNIVSKISSTKKLGSYNIYLNDSYSFTISDYTLSKFKISLNQKIEEVGIYEILICELAERLKNKLLIFLSIRPRSKKEMIQKMNLILSQYTKKWPILTTLDTSKIFEEGKQKTLEFLEKYNYVNDEIFAKYILDQRINQGKGPNFIKQDFFKFGIEPTLSKDILKSGDFKNSYSKSLLKAEKKYRGEKDLRKRKQKIIRYLISRGFQINFEEFE